jgi:DNA-binding response OmpR family regulator
MKCRELIAKPASLIGFGFFLFIYQTRKKVTMQSKDNSNSNHHQVDFGIDLDTIGNSGRYRVLLVEDDPDSVLLLKQLLILAGFDVTSSSNGLEGLKKTEQLHPDITLLDLMMPDMDGWEMLARLRETSALPVIVVSAITRKEEVVKAFKMGADDYITKPFYNAELVERVYAVLKRTTRQSEKNLVFDKIELSINFETKEVIYQNMFVELTPKEFAIMASLARHAPAVVTYETLRLEVWGEDLPSFQNRVKYLVFMLRQKLAAIHPNVNLVATIGRRGYRLQTEGTEATP